MTGRVVLVSDDAGCQFVIGPVYTRESEERLQREVADYGWTVLGVCPHYLRADFTSARGHGDGFVRGAGQ